MRVRCKPQGDYRLASHVAIRAVAKNTSRAQSPNRTQASKPRRVPNSLLFLLPVSHCWLRLTKFWCLAKSADVRSRLRISASSADFALSVSDWRSEANCSSSSSLSDAYSCWNSENMGILSVNRISQQLCSAFPSFLDSDVFRWPEMFLNKVNNLGVRKPPSMRWITF